MTEPDRSPTAREILDCLDRLDALLTHRPSLFAPGRRAARDRDARRLLRQLRDALAGDGRRATALRAEAEAILCRAQDEARRVVEEAAEFARTTREEGALERTGDQDLQALREQAIREADETRQGADAYALNTLDRLEHEVARILATVQRGKMVLGDRTGARASPPGRLDNGKMASV